MSAETAQFFQWVIAHGADIARGAKQLFVVKQHRLALRARLQINLDSTCPRLQRLFDAEQAVFRVEFRIASMPYPHHFSLVAHMVLCCSLHYGKSMSRQFAQLD